MAKNGCVIALRQQLTGQLPELGKAVIEGANAALKITNQNTVCRGLQRGAHFSQQGLQLSLMRHLLAAIQHGYQQQGWRRMHALHRHFHRAGQIVRTQYLREKARSMLPVPCVLPESFLHQRVAQHINMLTQGRSWRIASESLTGCIGADDLQRPSIQQPDGFLQTVEQGIEQGFVQTICNGFRRL